jgi:hypothetical protein
MAAGTPVFFGLQALLIGDGANPETFSSWCGITSLTKTTNKETGTVAMPDCDDPDLPSWLLIYLVSNQMAITGSGTLATESLPDFDQWDREGGYKNVRWYRNLAAGQGGGYYVGPALLTQWEEAAEAKAPYTFNFGVTFNGQPSWVPAA